MRCSAGAEPNPGVGWQFVGEPRGRRQQNLSVGHWDRRGAHIDDTSHAVSAFEREKVIAEVEPGHDGIVDEVLTPNVKGISIQRMERTSDPDLLIGGDVGKPVGLGQP